MYSRREAVVLSIPTYFTPQGRFLRRKRTCSFFIFSMFLCWQGNEEAESSKNTFCPLHPTHNLRSFLFYRILKRLKESFCLSCDTFGYELKLREILTELWLMLVEQSHSGSSSNRKSAGGNDKIKLMLIYIHEHYPENLSVKELAAAAYTS